MKKKVLYGVIMACSLGMTMGSLQSCTDDLTDFENEYKVDQYNLGQTIDGIKAEIAANKAQCEAEIARLQAQITANDGDIEKLQQDLTALAGEVADRVTYDQLTQTLAQLENTLKNYVDSKDAELRAEIALANAEIAKLDGKVSTIETKVGTLETSLAALQAQVNENIAAIDAINTELGNIQTNVAANATAIANLTQEFAELQAKYDAKLAEIDETLGIAFEQIEGAYAFTTLVWQIMEENDAALQDQIDGLLTSIEALEDELDILTMRIDELITGILLQATDSPVFGNFSLPLGVQSNMLFNWYFENKGMGYTFPNAGAEYAYNTAEILDGREFVSAEDVATAIASKNSTFAVPEGYTDTFLGNLYMTINPIGHQVLNGKTFYLETSKGVEGRLPFTLDVQPSDEELMFGLTRSVENGFYASKVVVPGEADKIAAVKVSMDEELKEAGKAVINERSKRALLNFLQAVYDQVNSSFPRYAVRAEWPSADKASRKMYSVLSNYDLGVATAKPLSYAFLDGKGTDHRLRLIGHIANLFYKLKEEGKMHFELDAADYPVTITLSAPEDADYTEGVTIVIEDENHNVIGTATAESMDELNEAIKKGVEKAFTEVGKDVNKQIEEQMAQIIDKINSQVNGKIDSILDQLGDKSEPWFQRLNKLVDLYNRVANKVNAFLAEPNEYLQPAMFYKTVDGLGLVSNSKEDPTVFVNGGGPAFVLYPSSYTAEVVAPAYKKMIACINVIDNATGKYVANGRELAKKFNATSDNLAVVLDGSIYGIAVPGAAVKSGYTYEIMYQALDYSGVTSTRKFYIKVK